MYPRGGGVWDQNPVLMRDFRAIRRFEKDWEKDSARIAEAENASRNTTGGELPSAPPSGVGGIGQAMNQYLSHLEEDGAY